jgi:hypothetical protein
MNTLRALARDKTVAHRVQMIGRELPAITLRTPTGISARGRTEALTDNFLPVELEGNYAANQLLCIEVSGSTPEGALTGHPALPAESAPNLTETRALSLC